MRNKNQELQKRIKNLSRLSDVRLLETQQFLIQLLNRTVTSIQVVASRGRETPRTAPFDFRNKVYWMTEDAQELRKNLKSVQAEISRRYQSV